MKSVRNRWIAFSLACAVLAVAVALRSTPASVDAADLPPLTVRREIYRELASVEPSLRRSGRARLPRWPWRVEHELHQQMARRWESMAADRRLPLEVIALIMDEGFRQAWEPRLPAGVPPLAPVSPDAVLR